MKVLSMVVAIFSINGCAVQPKVEYKPMQPDIAGYYKFTLPRSQILLEPPQNAGDAPTMKSVLTDDYPEVESYQFMIRAQTRLFSSTTITDFSYPDGQNNISSIGTVATDNAGKVLGVLSKALTTIGASSSAPIGAAGPQPPSFKQDYIDPFRGQKGLLPVNSEITGALTRNPGWTWKLIIQRHPVDTISTVEFREAAFSGKMDNIFPYSSCVNATLILTEPDKNNLIEHHYGVIIADSAKIRTVHLSRNGKITSHASCGFNISNDKASGALDTEGANEAVNIFKSVKSIVDKKKN